MQSLSDELHAAPNIPSKETTPSHNVKRKASCAKRDTFHPQLAHHLLFFWILVLRFLLLALMTSSLASALPTFPTLLHISRET
jgi:hypothetical protein